MLPRTQPEATLVVCEDDAPTLDLLCDHLHADRFEALPAPSADDALRLCHYNDPDPSLEFFTASSSGTREGERISTLGDSSSEKS